MIVRNSELRAAARCGVAASAIVAIGSTVANMYIAAARVAEGAGGWVTLGREGWLNVALNSGLALGCEGLGFLALAFVIAFAGAGRWSNCAAALAILAVALFVNGSNSHDFVMKQEQNGAVEHVRQSILWQQARTERLSAEREISQGVGVVSPAALREKITQLVQDRESALAERRIVDARLLRSELKQTRDELVGSVTALENTTASQRKLEAAQAKMASLEAAAKLQEGASQRAWTILVAVEVIKALGMLAFSVGQPLESASTIAPTANSSSAVKALSSPKKQISTEERRARQRRYTAKWRARKREHAVS